MIKPQLTIVNSYPHSFSCWNNAPWNAAALLRSFFAKALASFVAARTFSKDSPAWTRPGHKRPWGPWGPGAVWWTHGPRFQPRFQPRSGLFSQSSTFIDNLHPTSADADAKLGLDFLWNQMRSSNMVLSTTLILGGHRHLFLGKPPGACGVQCHTVQRGPRCNMFHE